MNSTGKIILGFILGTVIGSATGLLIAPTTGRNTRKNLNKKAKKLVKQIEGAMGREKKKLTQQASAHIKNGKASLATN